MSDQKFWAESSQELFVDKFVGREDLLDMVDEAIADGSNNYVIAFVGEGGIGKTALLRTIYKKYENRSDIISLKFDNTRSGLETFRAVQDQVINQLLKDGLFTLSDIKELKSINDPAQKALSEGKKDEEVKRLQQQASQKFVEYFNDKHKKSERRLLLISDSVDDVNPDAFIEARDFSTTFNNAVLVWSARPEPRVTEYFENFKKIYDEKRWNVKDSVILDKFSIDETKAYFTEALKLSLKPEQIETIHVLTAGKPVLLAFTAEWFKDNAQLPEGVNKSKEELEALEPRQLQRLQRDFERNMVERVRAVREPLDLAILYMSFLDRRYDQDILQLVLAHLPPEEIEALEPKLRPMAFIRSFLDDSSGLLHDEAKRLINRYAWPAYDPTGEERVLLARKVIDGFYLPEIKRLRAEMAAAIFKDVSDVSTQVFKETLAHELEMECLDYHYRISLDEGRRYVTKLIGEGISFRKQEGIGHEITMRVSEAEANVAVARMNVRRGQYKGVREVLERALAEGGISSWYKITLLRELSQVSIDPQEKAAYLKQAIKIAKKAKNQIEAAKIYNALGLMYRRQGLWPEAENAYDQTLTLLRFIDDDNEVPDERASTLNNLAYVKLLQGELDLAENLADIALKMREERGNQLWIAFSYLTKGEIAESKGFWDQARRAYQRAANLFQKLGRDQNHAQALIRLSKAKHVDRDFEAAEALLKPGLEQPLSEIRAEAERELGALYRTQGMESEDAKQKASKYEAAVAAFEQSLETSKRKRDSYRQAQALYDLIFMGFLSDGTIHEGYAEQLKALLAKHNYPILKAQLAELYADIKYQQRDVIAAFQAYIEVANVLSKRHVGKYNNMLERFKQKFLAQPHDIQEKLYEFFEEVIAESPPGSSLRSMLKTLCRAMQIAY